MREGGEASDKPIDSAVLSRMKQFRAMNKLKKLALKVSFFVELLFIVVYRDSRFFFQTELHSKEKKFFIRS